MSDDRLPSEMSVSSRLEPLLIQLEDCLDRLKVNADHLAGDIFHHHALFTDPVLGCLDQRLTGLLAELRRQIKMFDGSVQLARDPS